MATGTTVVKYDTSTGAIVAAAGLYVCSVPPERVLGKLNPNEDVLVLDGIIPVNKQTQKIDLETHTIIDA